jgi:TolA-binding protein
LRKRSFDLIVNRFKNSLKTKIMKTQVLTLICWAVLGLATVSCTENRTQKQELMEVKEDFQSERDELHRKLRKLEGRIDLKIQELEVKKEHASTEMRIEIERMEAELKKEKSEIGKAIDDMEVATAKTWEDVKGSVNKTTRDIEEGWKKFKLNVDLALEKEKS